MSGPPVAPEIDPFVGRVLGGTYRIVARLGSGSTGVVYRARHTLLDQDFAVKVVAPALAQDPEIRRRLLLEARSLALFTHKHAVQVRHCGEDAGVLFLAMDLCRGETLAQLLAREGPLSEGRAVGIVLQVLDALGEAHRAGIVHRDLKSSNVMVETPGRPERPEDRVRVLDFGLARIVGVEGRALPNALASAGGAVVGTVAYMSPEQLRADEEVDGRSDLFSLGVMLHELLGGALPFDATSTLSIAMRILERPPAPLLGDGPRGISPALRAVVDRALEKDPGRRFATAEDFADALRAAALGVAPEPLPPPPPTAVARRPRGRTLALAAVAAAALLAGAVFGLPALRRARLDETRTEAQAALAEGRYEAAIDGFDALVAAGAATGEDHLGRARARIERGDVNARADLDEAARLLPDDDPRVPTERARFLWKVEKDADGARADLSRALVLDEGHVPARVERARMAIAQGRPDDAARDLDAAEGPLGATDPALLRLLRSEVASLRASKAGEADAEHSAEALRLARQAVEADSDWAEAHAALASALSNAGWKARKEDHFDEARPLFDEALAEMGAAIDRARARPGHRAQGRRLADLHTARASMRFTIYDEAGAFEDYDAAQRLRPDDPALVGSVADAMNKMGRYEEAIRAFTRLADLTGEPEPWNNAAFGHQRLALRLAERGDRTGALGHARTATELYDRAAARGAKTWAVYRAETEVFRARLLRGEERAAALAAAKAVFDELKAARPDDREVSFRRAEYHQVAGDLRAALDEARRTVRRDGSQSAPTPAMWGRAARYAIALARVEAEARREREAAALYDEAVAHADAAAKEVVDSPGPLVIRAEAKAGRAALRATGPERKAAMTAAYLDFRAAIAKARDDAPARATALFGLAEARLAAGDAPEAAQAAEEAVRLRDAETAAGRWAADASWWRLLGDAWDRSDKPEDAARARAKAAEIEARQKATEAG